MFSYLFIYHLLTLSIHCILYSPPCLPFITDEPPLCSVAWAAACGLMLVLWQDPSALPAQQQHLSAPTPSRARSQRLRTHVSNPLYLQVRGSDRTEKYPTYRRDGASTPRPPSLSSPSPPRRHHNHHHLSRVRGARPPSRPPARRPLRNRHHHTLKRGG